MFHHQGPLGPLDGPVTSQGLGSQAITGNLQGLGGSGPISAGGPKAGPRQPGFRRRLRNPQVTAGNGWNPSDVGTPR